MEDFSTSIKKEKILVEWNRFSRGKDTIVNEIDDNFVVDNLPFKSTFTKTNPYINKFVYEADGRFISFIPHSISWISNTNKNILLTNAIHQSGNLINNKVKYYNVFGNSTSVECSVEGNVWRKRLLINSLDCLGIIDNSYKYLEISFKIETDFDIDNWDRVSEYRFNHAIGLGSNSKLESIKVFDSNEFTSSEYANAEKEGIELTNIFRCDGFIRLCDGELYLIKQIPVEYLKEAVFPIVTDADISYGSEYAYNEASSSMTHCALLDSTHAVVLFKDSGDSDYGKCCVGVISNDDEITWGAEYTFLSGTLWWGCDVCVLDSTHIVVVYGSIYARVGVITNDDEIAYGTAVLVDSGGNSCRCCGLDSTHFVVSYDNDDHIYAKVGVVSSGDTITMGSQYDAGGSISGVNSRDIAKLTSTSFVTVLGYSYSDSGRACVGIVTDGDTITFGSIYSFTSNTTYEHAVLRIDDTHFVVAYRDDDDSDKGKVVFGTITNDDEIAYGSIATFNNAATRYPCVAYIDFTHFVIAFEDDARSDYGTCVLCTIDGTSLSFGSECDFNSTSTTYIDACGIDSTHIFIAFRDEGGDDYGVGIIGTIATSQEYEESSSLSVGDSVSIIKILGKIKLSSVSSGSSLSLLKGNGRLATLLSGFSTALGRDVIISRESTNVTGISILITKGLATISLLTIGLLSSILRQTSIIKNIQTTVGSFISSIRSTSIIKLSSIAYGSVLSVLRGFGRTSSSLVGSEVSGNRESTYGRISGVVTGFSSLVTRGFYKVSNSVVGTAFNILKGFGKLSNLNIGTSLATIRNTTITKLSNVLSDAIPICRRGFDKLSEAVVGFSSAADRVLQTVKESSFSLGVVSGVTKVLATVKTSLTNIGTSLSTLRNFGRLSKLDIGFSLSSIRNLTAIRDSEFATSISASVLRGFNKLSQNIIGSYVAVIATTALAFISNLSIGVSVGVLRGFNKLSQNTIGNSIVVTVTSALTFVSSLSVGIVTECNRGFSYVVNTTIGFVAGVSKQLAMLRESFVTSGIVSNVVNGFARISTIDIGVSAVADRVKQVIRDAISSVGTYLDVSRLVSSIKNVPIFVGFDVSAFRGFSYISDVSVGVLLSALRGFGKYSTQAIGIIVQAFKGRYYILNSIVLTGIDLIFTRGFGRLSTLSLGTIFSSIRNIHYSLLSLITIGSSFVATINKGVSFISNVAVDCFVVISKLFSTIRKSYQAIVISLSIAKSFGKLSQIVVGSYLDIKKGLSLLSSISIGAKVETIRNITKTITSYISVGFVVAVIRGFGFVSSIAVGIVAEAIGTSLIVKIISDTIESTESLINNITVKFLPLWLSGKNDDDSIISKNNFSGLGGKNIFGIYSDRDQK